jgi:large subunit ribosomal protein L13
MSTTLAKKETVERKWYVIDAAGKPLGRVAVQAATLLRGKHKPTFTPNVDCGDFVIIVNAAKTELTGKKLEQKKYQHHTGWIGNLKEVKYSTLMNEKPAFAVELAVKGMLPKNSIGRAAMTRLKIYAGPEHKNDAQKPEPWTAISGR